MKKTVKIVATALAVAMMGAVSISGADIMYAATDNTQTVAMSENLMGGWSAAENTKVTKAKKKMFNKAMEGLTGVDYEPVAYLGSQVVAGKNHCFLCKATVVYPDAKPYYALVYIYKDLSGNVEVIDIQNLEIGIS